MVQAGEAGSGRFSSTGLSPLTEDIGQLIVCLNLRAHGEG